MNLFEVTNEKLENALKYEIDSYNLQHELIKPKSNTKVHQYCLRRQLRNLVKKKKNYIHCVSEI